MGQTGHLIPHLCAPNPLRCTLYGYPSFRSPGNTLGSIFATAMLDYGTAQLGAQLPGGAVGSGDMALCWPVMSSAVNFAVDSPLEGTGFEPSVPLGRIGACNSAWIAFGRRLGLRIEHAISIDGWEVCDGRTSWRFFMKQVASLTVIRARCFHFGHGPGIRRQERRAAVGLG